jgi:TRAP-type C4-dicarboxylate transport system substrate-binding protein
MAQIKEESSGRLDITLYRNSVLGGDTAMISQTIAGRRVVADLALHWRARRRPRYRRRYPLDLDRVSLIEQAPDR